MCWESRIDFRPMMTRSAFDMVVGIPRERTRALDSRAALTVNMDSAVLPAPPTMMIVHAAVPPIMYSHTSLPTSRERLSWVRRNSRSTSFSRADKSVSFRTDITTQVSIEGGYFSDVGSLALVTLNENRPSHYRQNRGCGT